MGHDYVNIISMNSARRGMESMSPKNQKSYLQKLIEGVEPDICFLPGDNGDDLGNNVVIGYSEYRTPSSGSTVLIYDHERASMTQPKVSFNTFGPLQGLDMDKLVTPKVEIYTKPPVKSVVKTFNMVSWKRDVFPAFNDQTGNSTILERIVTFSQMFAQMTDTPIFIGGEIPLPYKTVSAIVKKLSKDADNIFLKQATDILNPEGFTPGMVRGSQTSQRHKFMMNVFQCKSNTTCSQPTVSDCFIASKELQLTEARIVDVAQVFGRQIQFEPLKTCQPIQTEIKYESRPPRHHGG